MTAKQEAIEVIAQQIAIVRPLRSCRKRLASSGKCTLAAPCWDCKRRAKSLYNRLAPLMLRESPEDEIRKIIEGWCLKAEEERETNVAAARYACASELENWVNDFKRLWEGQPPREGDETYELGSKPCPKCGFPVNKWDKGCLACEQREGDDILEKEPDTRTSSIDKTDTEHMVRGKPKGVCQECAPWGSKGYKTHGALGSGGRYDCPNCDGTGEEKKIKCLCCGVARSAESVVTCWGEQSHRWTDERINKERRQLESARRTRPDRRKAVSG